MVDEDIPLGSKPKKTVKELLLPLKPWYRNFWFKDFRDAMFFITVMLLLVGTYQVNQAYLAVAENPCDYCATCQETIPVYPGNVPAYNYTVLTMGNVSGDEVI